MLPKNSAVGKIAETDGGEEGESIKIVSRTYSVSQCRKFSKGKPSVFEKFWGIENSHA